MIHIISRLNQIKKAIKIHQTDNKQKVILKSLKNSFKQMRVNNKFFSKNKRILILKKTKTKRKNLNS
jgi:hypothetical protein